MAPLNRVNMLTVVVVLSGLLMILAAVLSGDSGLPIVLGLALVFFGSIWLVDGLTCSRCGGTLVNPASGHPLARVRGGRCRDCSNKA